MASLAALLDDSTDRVVLATVEVVMLLKERVVLLSHGEGHVAELINSASGTTPPKRRREKTKTLAPILLSVEVTDTMRRSTHAKRYSDGPATSASRIQPIVVESPTGASTTSDDSGAAVRTTKINVINPLVLPSGNMDDRPAQT